jgi:hypothetical protein
MELQVEETIRLRNEEQKAVERVLVANQKVVDEVTFKLKLVMALAEAKEKSDAQLRMVELKYQKDLEIERASHRERKEAKEEKIIIQQPPVTQAPVTQAAVVQQQPAQPQPIVITNTNTNRNDRHALTKLLKLYKNLKRTHKRESRKLREEFYHPVGVYPAPETDPEQSLYLAREYKQFLEQKRRQALRKAVAQRNKFILVRIQNRAKIAKKLLKKHAVVIQQTERETGIPILQQFTKSIQEKCLPSKVKTPVWDSPEDQQIAKGFRQYQKQIKAEEKIQQKKAKLSQNVQQIANMITIDQEQQQPQELEQQPEELQQIQQGLEQEHLETY